MFGSLHFCHMGRSLESPADPPSTDRLPVEIGLPPVDTRGEHVFAIFGRKEWITRSSPAGLRAPPGDGQSLCVQNLASHSSILCRFRHIFIEIA